MSEYYRIDVRYPAVPITSLTQGPSGDFSGGEHGGLWLDVTGKRWFATEGDGGKSARLAKGQFGAASGTLSGINGGNVAMWANNRRVGVFDLSTSKRTNLSGVIATKTKKQGGVIPGTGVEVFTEGVYFQRARVWSDSSTNEKLAELLTRAQKRASGETRQLIGNLLGAIPVVVGILILLIALGTLAGPAIAGVIAIIAAWGGYFVPRSMEYADKLAIVGEVMDSSNPSDSELEQGAAAIAEFFRMVLEDAAFAAAMKAGEVAVSKVKSKVSKEVVETVDEAFTRHKKEEFQREADRAKKKQSAERPEGAKYSQKQVAAAQNSAFQDMPMFKNRKYSALKEWLTQNGFIWQKKAIFEKNGRNSNFGGSEILVRRPPELEKVGLCEVVRIDRAGHDTRFKDGPVREKVDPKTGKVTKERDGWGGLYHFHKDIVPIEKLRTYCEQFVPDILSKNDYNNLVDPKSSTKFQQIHIELRPE